MPGHSNGLAMPNRAMPFCYDRYGYAAPSFLVLGPVKHGALPDCLRTWDLTDLTGIMTLKPAAALGPRL